MSNFNEEFSFDGPDYAHWTNKKINDQLCSHLSQVSYLFYAQKYGNVDKEIFLEEATDLLLILKDIVCSRERRLDLIKKQHNAFKKRK